MYLRVTDLLCQDTVSLRVSCLLSCIQTHVYKTDVEHIVVLVKNIIKGSVSFSGVSEGDRSSPSGHGQLKVVLHAVLYAYTCRQDWGSYSGKCH